LTSLEVAGASLSPEFSPSVHDYVVACHAGTNAWGVRANAPSSVNVTVDGDESGTGAADVAVTPDQAVVVRAELSGTVSEYWIRCLPPDFPTVSATVGEGARTPGWYLVGNTIVAAGSAPFAMILDGNGVPIWYHRGTTGEGVVNVDSPAPNVVSFIDGNGPFGHVAGATWDVLALDSWSVGTVQSAGTPVDVHELLPLPDGHHAVFTYSPRTMDLTGLAGFGPDSTLADCEIQELDAAGTKVWSWRASDHFDPVADTFDSGATTVDGVKWADPFHCNSLALDPDGNFLVSARHMDAVFVVDRVTGLVRWKLGGTKSNRDGAVILDLVGDTQGGFFHQHDARLLPDGHLTIFDDHGTAPGVARGLELALDLGARTATFAFEARGNVPSLAMGSFRRATDGSAVIGWGSPSNGIGHVLTEVDANGKVLFDVSFGGANFSYRAVKVPLASFDRDVLRKTAGLP
jgi:hypothetical protein